MDKTYLQLKEFNITKAIKKEYSENGNVDRLDSFLSIIDFAEVSEVHFVFKEEEYSRSEPLAYNMVDSLPFSSYQKYITYNWLEIEGKGRFIYHAFKNQDVQLIERLGLLGVEAYKNKKIDIYQLNHKYFEATLNISTIFPDSNKDFSNFHNDFYPVFLKIFEAYKEITSDKKLEHWLLDLSDFDIVNKNPRKSISNKFKSILSHPQATHFLDDAFEKLKHLSDVPGMQDNTQFLFDNDFIATALKKGNTYFLTKLNNFKESEKEIKKQYEDILENFWKKTFNSHFHTKKEIENFKNTTECFEWFKNEKIEKNLELLILSDNDKIKDYVKKNIDIHKKCFSIKEIADFTTNDILVLSELVQELQIEILQKSPKTNPLVIELGKVLKDEGIKPDYNVLSQEDLKNKLDNTILLVVNSFRVNENISVNVPSIDAWFNQKYLEKKLKGPNHSRPKIKI